MYSRVYKRRRFAVLLARVMQSGSEDAVSSSANAWNISSVAHPQMQVRFAILIVLISGLLY